MVTKRKMLFVEDDENLLLHLANYFSGKENKVYIAKNLVEAKSIIQKNNLDIIILDLILPDGEGLELFSLDKGLPPVIILSDLGSEYDMLEGFAAGAMDYVVKPCSPKLLEARIALRLLPKDSRRVTLHELTIDEKERTTKYKDEFLTLTSSEFNILAFLMRNAGTFYTSSEIYEKVWGMPSLKSTSIKYHISNLRQKLLKASGRNLILTAFGKGYAFLPKE